jgi:Protein of unknown function (DUF2380)
MIDEVGRFWRCLALLLACGTPWRPPAAGAADKPPIAMAVAEFDYSDSSGEANDQRAAHRARLQAFASNIRTDLAHSGKYRIVTLSCPQEGCSAGELDPKDLLEAARHAGAEFLLYGGIHKMSTLIQFARAQVVDLRADRLIFDRQLSFRGDSDEAWRRAEQFLAQDLTGQNFKP